MSGKDGNLITELESKASTPLEGVVFKDSALKVRPPEMKILLQSEFETEINQKIIDNQL